MLPFAAGAYLYPSMPVTSAVDQRPSFWLRDLLLLTLACVSLFGFMLGNRALGTPDEARYSEIPREMVASGDYLTPRLNGEKYFEKPVLFYWLQAASIRLFGLSEWSLRLWNALFALFGALSVYVAGRLLFDRRTGVIATVILATSFLYYFMSRIVTLDMAVSVLISASLFAFLIGIRLPAGWPRRLSLWGFYIFAALAVLTKGLIGIVLPALAIAIWIAVLGQWRLLKTMQLPSGLILFMLIAAPWHILVTQVNPEFLQFYFIHEHLQRFLTKIHHHYEPPWFFIPILLLGLFPWSVFLIQAVKRNLVFTWAERHQHQEALFLVIWASAIFLFFSASDSKLIPYILPVFPPLAILIGRYLAIAWNSNDTAGLHIDFWILLFAGLILAATLAAMSYYPLFFDPAALQARMHILGLMLALTVGLTFFLGRRHGIRMAFISLATGFVLFLVTLNADAPYFDDRSVKSLALTLKAQLRPDDEVATYQTYYQDLPFYLQRRVIIVDWQGELRFGRQHEDASDWMIDDTEFWRRWHGVKTIYMVTSRLTYNRLRETGKKFYLVAETNDNVLLRNKKDQS
jgi:4-amino-4-deoxy-L-arabinose transferase-like glycosyltransferase